MDYKKYSLENLENWLHDAMSCAEASPQEIYDVIKGVVEDNYRTYQQQASRAHELLSLLNNNGQSYDDVLKEREYYEPSIPEEELSQYKVSLSCDKDDPSPECKGAWNDFWEDADEYALREAEYYNASSPEETSEERVKRINESLEGQAEYGESFQKTWSVSIEEDGVTGDVFITFPPEALRAANISEGDEVEWIDNKDGTFTAKKVEKLVSMDEC
jgi:hypothetical protein